MINRKFRLVAQLIEIGFFLACSSLYAGETLIDQKDTQFWWDGKPLSPKDVAKAKVGDTLRIKNSDTMTHNAYSLGEKFFFDAGVQKPPSRGGKDYTIVMQNSGKFDILCAIHAQMGFTLEVN